MRNDIQGSCVEVPIPIDVYVGLLDRLRKQDMDCGPAPMVASILQKYLHDARVDSRQQSSKTTESAPDWSNDWIMLGAPTAVAEGKAPISGKNSRMPQNNDWCIGCGCPSEDLLSS